MSSSTPFVSICVPAYGRPDLLRRLFDSICQQTFRDFEVVLTDNSKDDLVKHLCEEYKDRLDILYFRNEVFLEMGGNWNACMTRGKGVWLKMMHDDDWFATPDSLNAFVAEAIKRQHGLIFSRYSNVSESSARREVIALKKVDLALLQASAYNIIKGNVIGPPSVTMIHNSTFRPFRNELKWMVDIDCYLRTLQLNQGLWHITSSLICIGVHEGQATSKYFGNPEVEIYENCLMLFPHYPTFCRNVLAYDHCWRLIRNLEIQSEQELLRYAKSAPVPHLLRNITAVQKRLPKVFLNSGILSKLSMFLHYLYFNACLVLQSSR
jgi:glycosyltransferase involved in cell wall biosynthesis